MAGSVRRYFGAVDVRWELPFLLRLPADAAYLCWEPAESVALFVPFNEVGAIRWDRRSQLLSANELFGPNLPAEPDHALPVSSYRITSNVRGVERTLSATTGGRDGGFTEVHPYTISHVFLCLRRKEDFDLDKVADRATSAINSLLRLHALVSFDGLTRPLHTDEDSYYTTYSLAQIPEDWPQVSAEQLLLRHHELSFAPEIGQGRQHKIGIGGDASLRAEPFPDEIAINFANVCQHETLLAPYQELFLSAVRRLQGREFAMAVVDAETAFEVCLASLLSKILKSRGRSDADVDQLLLGRLSSVGRAIAEFDALAKVIEPSSSRFENSQVWKRWNSQLAGLRHRIVHRGVRDVSLEAARNAIEAGLSAAIFLEQQLPAYAPSYRWGDVPSLRAVANTPQGLSRVFRV